MIFPSSGPARIVSEDIGDPVSAFRRRWDEFSEETQTSVLEFDQDAFLRYTGRDRDHPSGSDERWSEDTSPHDSTHLSFDSNDSQVRRGPREARNTVDIEKIASGLDCRTTVGRSRSSLYILRNAIIDR